MKHLYIIGLLLISPFSQSQTLFEQEQLASQIIDALETTQAISTLVKNKKTINGQLEDIRSWVLSNTISEQDYSSLKTSYQAYASTMNEVIDNLSEDLLAIESTRQIKEVKLDRLLRKFNEKYSDDLKEAYSIYTRDFYPSLTQAQSQVDSKTGIIPTIILVVKFGETLFHTFKNLFSKNDLSSLAQADLLEMAMGISVTNIRSQLAYPEWNQVVPSIGEVDSTPVLTNSSQANTISNNSLLGKTSVTYGNYAVNGSNLKKAVSLTQYGSDRPILLTSQSKQISVGSEEALSFPAYTVSQAMNNGDRFWVKLQGFDYATFFYFDEFSNSWQDPFGKSIVVGNEVENQTKTLYLPGPRSFFEVGGNTQLEQFLIVVSNIPMPEQTRTSILGKTQTGAQLWNGLSQLLPNNLEQLRSTNQSQLSQIDLDSVEGMQTFTPVYIIIPKNQSQN